MARLKYPWSWSMTLISKSWKRDFETTIKYTMPRRRLFTHPPARQKKEKIWSHYSEQFDAGSLKQNGSWSFGGFGISRPQQSSGTRQHLRKSLRIPWPRSFMKRMRKRRRDNYRLNISKPIKDSTNLFMKFQEFWYYHFRRFKILNDIQNTEVTHK